MNVSQLPEAIVAFFDAQNSREAGGDDAMLGAFAADAVVHDEGEEMRGHTAIREWRRKVIRKYDVRVKPIAVRQDDDATVVTATVSGNFDGSPIDLDHRFTLTGGKITSLEIG